MEFAKLRQKMVDNQIRIVDVNRMPILSAFLEVPRAIFLTDRLQNFGTALEVISTNNGLSRFIVFPSSLARLIQSAEVSKKDHVLTIGAADG